MPEAATAGGGSLPGVRPWLFPALLAGLALLVQLLDLAPALRWQRELLAEQPWRLLSGQLGHLGWGHLAGNLVGLALIALLSDPAQPQRYTFAALLGSAAAVGLGLWRLNPELDWYLGLSGLAHGWLLAVLLWPGRQRQLCPLAILVGLKLAWEQWAGALPFSADLADGPIIVDAHLYGAAGGVAVAATAALWRRR